MSNDDNQGARAFSKALDKEVEYLKKAIRKTDSRVVLFETVRQSDVLYASLRSKSKDEKDYYLQDIALRYGAPLIFSIIYPDISGQDEIGPIYPSDKSIARHILSLMSMAGYIVSARRMVQMSYCGYCDIQKLDEHEFNIIFRQEFYDLDGHESEVREGFINEIVKKQAENYSEILENVGGEIDRLLSENVYVWNKVYIGYDSDPILDEYFFMLASARAPLYVDYDTFNYAIEFGGIAFQKYALAIIVLMSFGMKHFAGLL